MAAKRATKDDATTCTDWRTNSLHAKRLPLPKAARADPNKAPVSGSGIEYDPHDAIAVLAEAKNNSD